MKQNYKETAIFFANKIIRTHNISTIDVDNIIGSSTCPFCNEVVIEGFEIRGHASDCLRLKAITFLQANHKF